MIAFTEPTDVYKLKGITYVPHYVKNFYVAPGYATDTGLLDKHGHRVFMPDRNKEFSASDLEKAGAKKSMEWLWKRPSRKITG